MKRVRLIISGDVQGVGLRAWVVRQAKELGLTGWVKNREDGAIEVIGEGLKHDLEEFIKRCHDGPDLSWVERIDIQWQEAIGELIRSRYIPE